MALAIVLDRLVNGLLVVKAILALVFPLLLIILLRHLVMPQGAAENTRGGLLPLQRFR